MIILDFTEFVKRQITAIQASATSILDFAIGSVLRAIIEANSSIALWFQGLLVRLLSMIRASTSEGEDLDSWMADFGFTRLAAVAASGNVVFSRFTTSQQAVIPIGSQVESSDGSLTYTVILDATNVAYNNALDGYVIPIGASNVTVPVVADVPGTAGNAMISGITVIKQAIPGVDTVNNTVAFVNGIDPESDDEFRTRFQQYIASLSSATKASIINAVLSMQSGMRCHVMENVNMDGSSNPGYFMVIVDDGSGNPAQSLLDLAYNVIESVRPLNSPVFMVMAPTLVPINVSITISIVSGYDANTVKNDVSNTINEYIQSFGLGLNTLMYNRMVQVVMSIDGVNNITTLTLNGGSANIVSTDSEMFTPGVITVT